MREIIKISAISFLGILFFSSCNHSTIAEEGVAAPRICIVGTGDNAKLMLTKSPKNYGSIFQFGSVIAWSGAGVKPVVEFNPSTLGGSWDKDWYISGTYPSHLVGNLKEGKGDPCRLIGFTVAEIKAAIKDKAASDSAPDNGKWRMPTQEDYKELIGEDQYSDWTNIDGINGRYIGPGATIDGAGGEFLPAGGYRSDDGQLLYQGGDGYYWRIPNQIISRGYELYLCTDNVYPQRPHSQAYGHSVRCVRQ